MIDYQWPSAFTKVPKAKFKNSLRKNIFLLRKIESFSKKKYGYTSLVFPSARSCIAIIIRYLKLDRSKKVYIDKYSSHCLFNTIGAFTNVSIDLKNPDLLIFNHKWGLIKKISKNVFKNSIEDSVDSIILNKSAMFPNKGKFEIFSLPKIIGSISGGLLICKDKKFIKFCKNEQKKNIKLGIYQSKQKFLDKEKKRNFDTWLYHEARNTYVDTNALKDIENNLKNFELNKLIILKRLKDIQKIYKNDFYLHNRVGPVFPIKTSFLKNKKYLKKIFLLRRHSINLNDKEKFEEYFLIPIHFEISDKMFLKYLNLVKENLRK